MGLSTVVASVANIASAQELLARQTIDLIFCDELLPDGHDRDLLSATSRETLPCVIVTDRETNWEAYLQATKLGAFDIVRCPLELPDIELVLIRAIRLEERKIVYRLTA
jgi:DNA-binding NtrC family response regulator